MYDIDLIFILLYVNVNLICILCIYFFFRMIEQKYKRFEEVFFVFFVQMVEIQGNIFVLLNSMVLEGDGCNLCLEVVLKLEKIFFQFKCFRVRNKNCDFFSYFLQFMCFVIRGYYVVYCFCYNLLFDYIVFIRRFMN